MTPDQYGKDDACAEAIEAYMAEEYKGDPEDEWTGKVRRGLLLVTEYLRGHGLEADPRRVDLDSMAYVCEHFGTDSGLDEKETFAALTNFEDYLKFHGNAAGLGAERLLHICAGRSSPIDLQCEAIMAAEKTPFQEIVVHLQLCLGLTTDTCRKLDVHDID